MPDVCDIIALLGIAALVYGAWLVYPPAGYIVGGAAMLLIGIALAPARAAKKMDGG